MHTKRLLLHNLARHCSKGLNCKTLIKEKKYPHQESNQLISVCATVQTILSGFKQHRSANTMVRNWRDWRLVNVPSFFCWTFILSVNHIAISHFKVVCSWDCTCLCLLVTMSSPIPLYGVPLGLTLGTIKISLCIYAVAPQSWTENLIVFLLWYQMYVPVKPNESMYLARLTSSGLKKYI